MNSEEHPLRRIQMVGEQLSEQTALADAGELFGESLQSLQAVLAGTYDPEAYESMQLTEMAVNKVDEALTAVRGARDLIAQYLAKANGSPAEGSTAAQPATPVVPTAAPVARTEVNELSKQSDQTPAPAPTENTTTPSLAHGITPEMVAAIERGEWEEIPYDNHREVTLKPGQIVTGISTMAGFKALERTVVAQVSPYARGNLSQELILAGETSIMNSSIEDDLRKARFSGRVAGQAIILPFNPERAKELGLAKSYHEAAANNAGITIVYTGKLRSAGAGSVGAFVQEAMYLQKYNTGHLSPEGVRKRLAQAGAKGGVVRVLGKPQGLEDIKSKLESAHALSVSHGRMLAAYAINTTYSAGTASKNPVINPRRARY